jgi:hypothetical protein
VAAQDEVHGSSSGHVSTRQAAFIGVGAMVGAGIFSLLGAAGEVAGAAVWLSFALAGVIAALQGYSFARFGARYPSAGGLIEYINRGFGLGHIATVTAWLVYAANIIVTAMVAVSFGSYASSMFAGGDPAWVKGFAVAVVVAMTALHRGVDVGNQVRAPWSSWSSVSHGVRHGHDREHGPRSQYLDTRRPRHRVREQRTFFTFLGFGAAHQRRISPIRRPAAGGGRDRTACRHLRRGRHRLRYAQREWSSPLGRPPSRSGAAGAQSGRFWLMVNGAGRDGRGHQAPVSASGCVSTLLIRSSGRDGSAARRRASIGCSWRPPRSGSGLAFDLSAIASIGSAVALTIFALVTVGHVRVRSETGARLSLLILAIATTGITLPAFIFDARAQQARC